MGADMHYLIQGYKDRQFPILQKRDKEAREILRQVLDCRHIHQGTDRSRTHELVTRIKAFVDEEDYTLDKATGHWAIDGIGFGKVMGDV